MYNDLSILVLSCDAYSDLWNDFFSLKDQYWPDCPYKTYLVTENKEYCRNNVFTIQCGNLNWSGRLRKALDFVNTPLILPILDDYFICKKVNTEIIEEDVAFCLKHDVSFLTLQKKRGVTTDRMYCDKYVIIPNHNKYAIDTAAAIWNKDFFLQKLGDDDYNAWQFEIKMCNEAKTEKGIDGLILCDERAPINIVEIPVVIQGMFYPKGVNYFKKLGYNIDISQRKMMSKSDVFKEQLKGSFSKIRFGRKYLKYIASKLFGYKFFTKD